MDTKRHTVICSGWFWPRENGLGCKLEKLKDPKPPLIGQSRNRTAVFRNSVFAMASVSCFSETVSGVSRWQWMSAVPSHTWEQEGWKSVADICWEDNSLERCRLMISILKHRSRPMTGLPAVSFHCRVSNRLPFASCWGYEDITDLTFVKVNSSIGQGQLEKIKQNPLSGTTLPNSFRKWLLNW